MAEFPSATSVSFLHRFPFQRSEALAYTFIDVGAKMELDSQDKLTFYLADGPNPPLKDLDQYRGGIYSNLSGRPLLVALIKDALEPWNSIPGAGLTIELSDQIGEELDKEDGKHVISIGKMPSPLVGGYAMPQRNPDQRTTPVIFDCDLVLNEEDTNTTFFVHVIAHEMGHCLGLGHNHTDLNSIMSYGGPKSTRLGLDDMAAIIDLYPRSGDSPKENPYAPCGSVSGSRKPHAIGFLFALAPFFAVCFGQFFRSVRKRKPS